MGRAASKHETDAADLEAAVAQGRELVSDDGTVHVFGPAGEIRDVPVVRPIDPNSLGAPNLRRLQTEGRASRPRDALLRVAVKRSASATTISDALAELRRV
jgi:hypothetical protein